MDENIKYNKHYLNLYNMTKRENNYSYLLNLIKTVS